LITRPHRRPKWRAVPRQQGERVRFRDRDVDETGTPPFAAARSRSEDGPRGCFTVLSASADAVSNPEIRKIVGEAIDAMDRAFERLFEGARAAGELPAEADPRRLAMIASATIHTLSIRARARIPRAEIEPIVDGAVDAICGPARRREP
jgi:Tetracyclin repressor-like, C-terminal domain